MLFRTKYSNFLLVWWASQSCLIQKSQLYLGCYSCNQKLLHGPGKSNLVRDKKKKGKEMKMCCHTKSSPKSKRRKGALNTTQENAAALCLTKGANLSRPAIWPLLPFQPHCWLLSTRFRCSIKMDPLTSLWKHLRLFWRLTPGDHPIAPDTILINSCNSSTPSSNATSFKKLSLTTPIKSELCGSSLVI